MRNAGRSLTAMGIILVLALLGCGASDSGPTVTNAFITPPAGQNAALYFTVENPTNEPLRVTAVRTALTEQTMIHGSEESSNGATSMVDMPDGIAVPAKSSVQLAPGGIHLMLMNVKKLTDGSSVPFTVILSGGSEVSATAKVRQATDDDLPTP